MLPYISAGMFLAPTFKYLKRDTAVKKMDFPCTSTQNNNCAPSSFPLPAAAALYSFIYALNVGIFFAIPINLKSDWVVMNRTLTTNASIWTAAELGDVDRVRTSVKEKGRHPDSLDPHGYTPLHLAAQSEPHCS